MNHQMDFEAQRKKRLEALEEKKKRLDEMKKIKQERESTRSTTTVAPTIVESSSKERSDVDDLVNSLLQSSSSSAPEPTVEASQTIAPKTEPKVAPSTTIEPVTKTETTSAAHKVTKQKTFSVVKGLAAFQTLPSQVESYEKGTQTDLTDEFADDFTEGDERAVGSGSLLSPQKIAHRRPAVTSTPVPTHRATGEPAGPPVATSSSTDGDTGRSTSGSQTGTTTTAMTTTTKKKLSEEEVRAILTEDDFAKFLTKSAHIVERAIGQTSVFDVLESYQLKQSGEQKGAAKALIKVSAFSDESVKSRPIMDIQFSPHFPELFLVAYGSKSSHTGSVNTGKSTTSNWSGSNPSTSGGQEDALGMVCVWSTGVHTKPEFKFYASSPVLSARFHDTDEHLIVGGCYTGQILVWDMRQKSLPVQRSSLTGKGHKHPIYSMAFVPTTASTTATTAPSLSCELLTVSVDGLLCYWDLSRLTEPTNIINLQSLLPSASGVGTSETLGIASSSTDIAQQLSLAVTSIALAAGTSSETQASKEILLGSGTGHLYRGSLPLRPNQPLAQIDAHLGLISAMEMNPNPGKRFQSLLLTASLDWSVKLWSIATSSSTSTGSGGKHGTTHGGAGKQVHSAVGLSTTPLFEFVSSSYDYVNDVRWCPTNPSVFLTLTSCGTLSVWNLCKSTAEPTETISLTDESTTNSTSAPSGKDKDAGNKLAASTSAALNKAVWSRNGRLIVVGDSKGAVHMLHVHDSVSSMTAADEGKLEVLLLGSKSVASTGRADATANVESTTAKLEKISMDDD